MRACVGVRVQKAWVVKILEMDPLAFGGSIVLIPMLYRIPFKINSSEFVLQSVT